MNKKKVGLLCLIISLTLLFAIHALAEEFQPVTTFNGDIKITADSYFGKLPDDPVLPDDNEDNDLRTKMKLKNPTTPGFAQTLSFRVYSNPAPDLEMFVNLYHGGKWGGSVTQYDMTAPLILEEAYVRYYTDWAMLTMGRFKYDLDPFGILLASAYSPKEGMTVHTMYKDTWITLAYSRLLMTMYRDQYPYVTTFLLDDLAALRLSRKFGNQLVGFNLLADGCYDELGLAFDYSGKFFGKNTKAELSLVYPHKENRKTDRSLDRVWPGLIVTMDAFETENDLFTVRLGALDKGFVPEYGIKQSPEMESSVKFAPNTYGLDLLYQRGLSDDTVFAANLVWMDFWDKQYQLKMKSKVVTKRAGVKLTKFLSEANDISLSVSYNNVDQFHYGKVVLDWGFKY